MDECFIGGQRSGKRGRGAEGKTIVAIAVERCNLKKRMGRIRMHAALDCSAYSLETIILDKVDPGSTIVTDSWASYNFIEDAHCAREKFNQRRSKSYESLFGGVHLVASLIKRIVRGTFHGRFKSKYLQTYLDEYVFRFNLRKSKSIGN